MLIAIVFAELWAVLQLIVLGTFARTVRMRTVLMAVAVGLYACAPLAVLLEILGLHAAAWLTGTPAYQLGRTATYTGDPFIEEIVKVLPVVVLLAIPAIRRQSSITDCVLLSAACGAGFGLAEELFLFGTVSTYALFSASFGGWMLPGVAATPTVPSPWTTVTSWLPPGVLPNELITLSLNSYPAVNLHLAWSAVGGLAVGLFLLRRGWISRIAGLLLFLYIVGDHVANNARISSDSSLMRNLLAVMPAVALGIAWWFDRRTQRSGETDAVLRAEQHASPRVVGTLRAAISRLPWSVPWVYGLVRLRRAYNSASASGAEQDGLRGVVIDVRDRIDRNIVQTESRRWLPMDWTRSAFVVGLRRPAAMLWFVLVIPSIFWFVIGGWPQTAAVQTMMTESTVWQAIVVLSVVSQAWLGWQLIVAIRAWPKAVRLPIGDDAAIVGLRIGCGLGAVALGAYALVRTFAGLPPSGHLYIADARQAWLGLTGIGLMMFSNGPIAIFGLSGNLFLAGLAGAHATMFGRALGAAAASGSETDEIARGESLRQRQTRENAEAADAKADWEEAEARYASSTRDVRAAHAAARTAHAEADKLAALATRANADRERIVDGGDEAAIYASRDLGVDETAAYRRAVTEAARADGNLERSLRAQQSAQADAEATRLAYQSVLTGQPTPAPGD